MPISETNKYALRKILSENEKSTRLIEPEKDTHTPQQKAAHKERARKAAETRKRKAQRKWIGWR